MSEFRMHGFAGLSARAAGRFSPASRTVIALALALFAFSRTALPRLYRSQASPDELTWVTRSLVPWWYTQERLAETRREWPQFRGSYYYSIHHPTLARVVYRQALHAIGMYEPPAKRYDYSKSMEENDALGNLIPYHARTALRQVNFAFVAAAIVLLYLSLLKILGNRALALVAVVPVALEPTVTRDFTSVVHYIGADAMLLFWTALFWYVWLAVKDKGTRGIIALGLIAGLATATKVNAAFMLIGAMGYYAVTARGRGRILRPLAIGAVAAAVFLALNPVYFGGGVTGVGRVFCDTIANMFDLKEVSTQKAYADYTRFEILASSLPHGLFFVAVGAVLLAARRHWWFRVTIAWGAPIILGNLAGIYIFSAKYAAPVRLAFFMLAMPAGLTMLKGMWRTAEPAHAAGTGHSGEPPGSGERA